ncbi:CRISPR-associated helicase/endonuclease Cas3 [Desulfoscipio gibsoniae]|uniref:CRISPR-associated helicase Cas3/CRISPR-associated endonuclease Cas3-HD n=1 Tax=Desulfoscipio gibsoniae DSM 7213 TaxID=767817 RepID=R4KJP6_9FIRM|nr:CRISPR-associated helicase/endonuclease Cas3 [Desulfoscipio gibsoniae]AGL03423.1 CRISPR-associated helicase Cas3/CRISPR-associated endonuclease Cas3-HD [Desulfoscipio gibsoniae DSM 7213]
MTYFAHSDKDKPASQWQLLKDHLEHAGETASISAKPWGAEKISYLAGLMHDMGKYSVQFQERLKGRIIKVDHSTAGAVEAEKRYGPVGRILAYIIAGHHCGLPDWGSAADESSLAARLNKRLNDYSAFFREIELPPAGEVSFPAIRPVCGAGFSVQFLIRFLYSCLVDADFLDTEKYACPAKSAARNNQYALGELSSKLDWFLDDMCAKAPDTVVNRWRAQILAHCREKARHASGLFTLTVPTGGGKTLSSLSFALKHALQYGQKRVIYVIPYTSIIEQNADVFRKVLGIEQVLEHHSNFTYPQQDQEDSDTEYASDVGQKLKLAAENWDMPVIATTNVQFFESLFAARSSRCRKIHNIANSVIIIDEAQMIPTGFLKPCLNALSELVTNYKTTIVLCTATQPAIGQLLPNGVKPVEIIGDPDGLYQAFKRVKVCNIGTVVDDDLAERLTAYHQVLCIVNTKKHARLLYEQISAEGTFHLSTRMCPEHRSETLKIIKDRLKKGQVCRVVSTQLIEAGVDVDFPVVYRSMAGIDSIAQSAGRCNREGLLPFGRLFVFWPAEKHGLPRGWLSRTASLGGMVFERLSDPLGLDGVKEYFSSLYDVDTALLDKEGIMAEIKEQEKQLKFPFRTIADKFKIIDKNTVPIIIPWGEACNKTLAQAKFSPFPGTYARKLQRYGVGVYENEFNELVNNQALEVIAETFYVLKEEVFIKYYSRKTGLNPFTESMFLNDTLII